MCTFMYTLRVLILGSRHKNSLSVYNEYMRASDRAYQELRSEIIHWALPPGHVLAEVDLAHRLGLSRTPVREALKRLIAEGLATPKGARGVTVSEISPDDVVSLYELRLTLEQEAAKLAAQRATTGQRDAFSALESRFQRAELSHDVAAESYYGLSKELDDAIDAACNNTFFASTLASLRPQLSRARRMAQENPDRLSRSAAEHGAICAAIASGNAELARASTVVHLNNSLANILNNPLFSHAAPRQSGRTNLMKGIA